MELNKFFPLEIKKPVLIIIITGLLVYFNSLFNGFVWDDEEQVLNNSLVHSITNLPSFFKGSTFNTGGSGGLGGLYYKPMMTVFFSLLYTLFGASSFIFHFFQLSLHIANATLVYLIFRHFFSKYLPLFLALVFLVHPINTEAVVYISSLQDILFFFFGALAFLLVLHTKKFSLATTLKISLLLLLSLLSKETGAIFIIIIFVYLLLERKAQLKPFFLNVFLSLGVYSILRFAIAGIYLKKHGLSPITTMPFLEKVISIPQIIFFYIKTFIYPKDLITSQQWVVKNLTLSEFFLPLVISAVVLSGLLASGVYLWKTTNQSWKTYTLFFIWFSLSLGIHLQLFPLDMTVADRWFYLPIVGLLGIMGVGLNKLSLTRTQLKLGGVIAIALLLTLSARTFIRNFDWKDGLTLYSHDAEISKESFDLENNLGVELFRAKRYEEAKKRYENSTRLAPGWWTNWNNLAVIYEMEKDYKKAGEYYAKAVANGDYYLAHENRGKLLVFHDDPKLAKEEIEKSLTKLPYNSNLWLFLSLAEYKLGNTKEAKGAALNSYRLNSSAQNFYVYTTLEKNLPLILQN